MANNKIIVPPSNQVVVQQVNRIIKVDGETKFIAVGRQGPRGVDGVSGNAGYNYVQSSPSNNWIINHNLGYKPVVQVFNSGNMEIECAIVHVSNNQVQVPLVSAITGYARLI